jgi:hypothetical protein
MKNRLMAGVAVLCALLCACTKEAGEGGSAAITGRVWIKDYNSTFTQLIAEYPAEDVYVYIVYGDRPGFDDRLKTDYKGEFQFESLTQGEYTLYVYSADSTLIDPNNQVPVIRKVTIDKRKEKVDVGDIIIFD